MLAQGDNLRLRDQGGSRGRSKTQDQKTRTLSTCWSNPGGISPLSRVYLRWRWGEGLGGCLRFSVGGQNAHQVLVGWSTEKERALRGSDGMSISSSVFNPKGRQELNAFMTTVGSFRYSSPRLVLRVFFASFLFQSAKAGQNKAGRSDFQNQRFEPDTGHSGGVELQMSL